MAKTKFKSFDDAKAIKASTKEELDVAKEELKAFRKEHKIGKDSDGTDITDKKVKKQFDKLNATIAEKRQVIDEAKEYMEQNKPAKEKKARDTKYEYPEGASAADKKKIRAAARAEAKKAAKADKKAEKKAAKEEKKKSKEEKPAKKKKPAEDAGEDD